MAGNTMHYFLKLVAVNMKSIASLRVAALIRTTFQIAQHALYLLIWVVMFDHIPSIGGWTREHLFLAYGIGIFAWGLMAFIGYGLRSLPQQIDQGELDVALTQPKPVLMTVAVSSSKGSGPPEAIMGLMLMTYCGVVLDVSLPLLLLMSICAFLVFASMVLMIGSLGFWVGQMYEWAEELYYNIFIISNRPEGIFTGGLKLMTYTAMPVAFMTFLPVRVLIDHQYELIAATLGGTIILVALALWLFHAGLRHYESGNRFGVRG